MRGALVVILALVATLAVGSLTSIGDPPPAWRPVALVEAWAIDAPINGLRCSGVALSASVIATAAHCVLPGGPVRATRQSLCHPASTATLARPPAAAEASPGPSAGDIALLRVSGLADDLGGGPATGPPTAGRGMVWAYGVHAATGRVACGPTTFSGTLAACDDVALGAWCLLAPGLTQLCGGSSGGPVFARASGVWRVVGVVSGGPQCGESGPVVVAPLPGQYIGR